MTRITAGKGFKGEDDKPYAAELAAAKLETSKSQYGDRTQLVVEWRTKDGTVRDWLNLSLRLYKGQLPRLRQMLNALAEKPKDTECWFDDATLEWGYDLDGDDSTPAFAKLTIGMELIFKGETRKNSKGEASYRITGYKANGQAKREKPDAATVDVDPDEIPF